MQDLKDQALRRGHSIGYPGEISANNGASALVGTHREWFNEVGGTDEHPTRHVPVPVRNSEDLFHKPVPFA